MMRVLCLCLFVTSGGFGCAPVFAATATGSFQVQITIDAACIVSSATNMLFSNAANLASALDQTSTITVLCSTTVPYDIGLDAGLHGASVTARQMSGSGGAISYVLFRESGRTQNWGQTLASDTVAGIGTGAAQTYTVYGRVPIQATPAPGLYSDTITVTITY